MAGLRGFSTPSWTCLSRRSASALGIGLGLVAGAEEARDLRRVLDQVPGVVGHFHLHQHVAGEELALGVDLLAAADLDDLLGRHQHVVELVGQALLGGLLLDLLGDLLLEARIDMDHVPLLVGHGSPFLLSRCRTRARMASWISWSTTRKNTAASADIASTRPVVTSVSLRVGQVTLETSWRTSRTNCAGSSLAKSIPSVNACGRRPCRVATHGEDRGACGGGRGGGSRTPNLRFWRPAL